MSPSIEALTAEFDEILNGYHDLLEEAEGFGLKTAAYPKGLMPLAEAQRIVAEMGTKVADMEMFVKNLREATFNLDRRKSITLPETVSKDFNDLDKKASKALAKMNEDLDKAQKAVQQYEDLLLGENFQSWFEMVRMAVIDLNIPEDVYLDFTTGINKDDFSRPHAWGQITLEKNRGVVAIVFASYRASDDLYWGNIQIWADYAKKIYPHVVQFDGRRGIRGGAKNLAEQLLALLKARGIEGLFGTRKDVTLQIRDPSILGPVLGKTILEYIQKRWSGDASDLMWDRRLTLDASMALGNGSVKLKHTFRVKRVDAVKNAIKKIPDALTRIEKPFTIETKDGKWKVAFKRMFADIGNGWDVPNVSAQWEIMATKVRERKSFLVERVASRYLTAGSVGCSGVGYHSDVREAWRQVQKEQGGERGYDSYQGNFGSKGGNYDVVQREPVTMAEARKIAEKDWERRDKWGNVGAIALLDENPVKKEVVSVKVEARNEAEALRKGGLLIRATGSLSLGARVGVTNLKVKEAGGGTRVKSYEVTGTRLQFKRGAVSWFFYGYCPS